MAAIVKEILSKPIHCGDEVIKAAAHSTSFRQDCLEIKARTEKLVYLLRQAARAGADLYERPARRIVAVAEQVLDKALTLVWKCNANGIKRIFTIIPSAAFRKVSQQLENSIGDVSWLLRVSTPAEDRDGHYLGLPPIASDEPILCLIWEQIAILCSGSIEDRTDAAASLVSLASDNYRYGSLIIEEGGLPPLLKLAKEGRMEGQENAARAIGLLGKDPESVEQIVSAGACQVFAKILKEGDMKVQVVVAWAVAELAAHHRRCQETFGQTNTIRLLVSHLAFETIQEHSKYAIYSKQALPLHSIVMAKNKQNGNDESFSVNKDDDEQNVVANAVTINKSCQDHSEYPHQLYKHKHYDGLNCTSTECRESEDPATKAAMKSMAARALRYLCAGNVTICRSITESRALFRLAILLEKGHDTVKYNSAMALLEITEVAKQDGNLRHSAFKPTAPAARAVVDQFLRIIQKENTELLIPCIRSVGNLARTFRTTETRFISPLVKLLDDREPEVTCEAAMALGKFAGPENFLHDKHCNSIIIAGGTKNLIQLIYFGEVMVQIPSFILLCYLALHVPDNETLDQDGVLTVLEWSTKQAHLMQDEGIQTLVYEAKMRLKLYRSRASKGYY